MGVTSQKSVWILLPGGMSDEKIIVPFQQVFFIVVINSDIVIVVTVFICTCFLSCVVNLLFSYLATQPQVCNKLSVSVDWRTVITDSLIQVSTNLKNLQYSGNSLNTEISGNSVQCRRKIVTNKNICFVRH